MNKAITTLKLKKETKSRLDKLKEHPRETYDETIRKMLGILNITKVEPEKAKAILTRIDETKKKASKEKRAIKQQEKSNSRTE